MTKRLSWRILPVSLFGVVVLGVRWRAVQAPAEAGSSAAEAGSVHVVAEAPLVAGRAATAAVVPVARPPAQAVADAPAVPPSSPATAAKSARETGPTLAAAYGKRPLHFERNEGQTDRRVRYLARGNGYGLFLTADEAVLTLRHGKPRTEPDRGIEPGREGDTPSAEDEPPAVVRARLVGARPDAEVAGEEPLPGRSNYFIGNDPSRWRTDVPLFGRVTYRGVWPGIDLTYYGNQRQLEYDFVVAPGADPGAIRLAYDGIEGMSLDDAGNLVLRIGSDEIVQHAPVIYQRAGDERRGVEGRFFLAADACVSFEVGPFDRSLPLVIDPVLAYSTYLGGSGDDEAYGIAVDGAGSAYVTGRTASTNFPLRGAYQSFQGGPRDVFVTKLSASGNSLVYSTYLGGTGFDAGYGIAVDGVGSAYVTGLTDSTNFPTQGPYQTFRGGLDVFLTKLSASGNSLVYSTYLGGIGDDAAFGIAVDGAGSAYVTGHTASGDFPTQGEYQTFHGGTNDAFVTKFSASGNALVYSTYLGGSGDDAAFGIAVDGAGSAYVTGYTASASTLATIDPLLLVRMDPPLSFRLTGHRRRRRSPLLALSTLLGCEQGRGVHGGDAGPAGSGTGRIG